MSVPRTPAPPPPPPTDGDAERERSLDFVAEVPLTLTVELGRTRMAIREVLSLSEGAVVELDRSEHDPLDILANNCLVAKGEVVALGDRIGIRITAMAQPEKPART